MTRVMTVAKNEVLSLVRTKFFIVSVLIVPIMIALSIGIQIMAAKRVDTDVRTVGVIDHTGSVFAPLAREAATYSQASAPDGTPHPKFAMRAVDLGGRSIDEAKLALSAEVKAKTLFAYVEIPAAVMERDAPAATRILYYTETPSYRELPGWLRDTVDRELQRQRLQRASLDPDATLKLTRATPLATLGLLTRDADGQVQPAKPTNMALTFFLPFGLMYILFLAIMMNAPQMMTAVVEEKMSRISEVLLASASPFQILAGKLIGIAAVSVTLSLVYLGGGIYAAAAFGELDVVSFALLGWFIVFLVCAVLMYGSVFLAIGAASSDLKDAQSMMQPAMIALLVPMFLAIIVIRSPGSPIAVVASLVPTATPFLMLVRLAVTPPPPMWQVWLSLLLTIGTAVAFVWAAAKIFRIGLLMQGKAPNLPELLKWIRA